MKISKLKQKRRGKKKKRKRKKEKKERNLKPLKVSKKSIPCCLIRHFFFLEKVETTKHSYVYKESVLILVVILFRFSFL